MKALRPARPAPSPEGVSKEKPCFEMKKTLQPFPECGDYSWHPDKNGHALPAHPASPSLLSHNPGVVNLVLWCERDLG